MQCETIRESPVVREDTKNYKVLVARVRIKTIHELKNMAQNETSKSGRHIYVADLVREAIHDYIRQHRSAMPNLSGD